ncbi:MAG TPA: hypothetical protein PLQ36_03225 [Candidatus Gracilibacteria bacterium]|nr:hypothetical protein [Candidatus Gracilibacteria bacterium]
MDLFTGFLVALFIAFLIFDAIAIYFLVWKKRQFANSIRGKVESELTRLKTLSEKEQIFEYDKLLDWILQAKKIRGKSLGERMKNYPKFRDVNAIWGAHKLRNKLAHELNASYTEREMKGAKQAFQLEINYFINH